MKPRLDHPVDIRLALIFLAVLAGGLFYMAYSIRSDISASGGGPTTLLPFLLLGVALLIALGFEFVNGFHDTANAVATVIYTHALPAQVAVVWSGCWNLIGVLLSSGAVAFGIVSLLPVELILQVGSAPVTRWCSRCSSPRSSGISARGGSAFPPPVRTR